MNAQPNPDTKPDVVQLLEAAQGDLEQFRKDLGQDQATVRSRYESLKGEIKEATRQMHDIVRSSRALSAEVAKSLREKLTILEKQVTGPEQPSESELQVQLGNIRKTLEEIIKSLAAVRSFDLSLVKLNDHLYRYKIKMGIIKLKLQLGTMQMKDTVLEAKHELKHKLRDLREYLSNSKEGLEGRWEVFHREVKAAYDHLQKAFTSR